MNSKIQNLQKKLPGIGDAALIFSEVDRLYFTGFPASDGILVVGCNETCQFITDKRYSEAAARKLGDGNVTASSDFYADADKLLRSAGQSAVAIENERLTLSAFDELQKKLPGYRFRSDSALCDAINELRMVKSNDEVNKILAAQKIAEDAFDYILGFIAPGKTEREIALALDFFMLSHGAQALSFETIAVSGVNSSMPHGVPSDKKIEDGDFITMDYGAVVDGYHSDMTRTVAVGHVSERQKLIYRTVLEAQLAGLAALKEGVTGKDADKAARDVIEAAGFGEQFTHSTGHGVGVEIHEAPYLSTKSGYTLHTGNVVTVEPGIYLPGECGVRIEDMALITEDGARNLTNCPKELIIL